MMQNPCLSIPKVFKVDVGRRKPTLRVVMIYRCNAAVPFLLFAFTPLLGSNLFSVEPEKTWDN
jgi:hypothetical protein